jgi:toxin ParE1/3/4
MKYVFHPQALTEYAEAVQYYAQQRAEIAQAFIDAIENTIYRIREAPVRWPLVEGNVRRCLTRKFPYAILYKTQPEHILILAVMHASREPGYWKDRQ